MVRFTGLFGDDCSLDRPVTELKEASPRLYICRTNTLHSHSVSKPWLDRSSSESDERINITSRQTASRLHREFIVLKKHLCFLHYSESCFTKTFSDICIYIQVSRGFFGVLNYYKFVHLKVNCIISALADGN